MPGVMRITQKALGREYKIIKSMGVELSATQENLAVNSQVFVCRTTRIHVPLHYKSFFMAVALKLISISTSSIFLVALRKSRLIQCCLFM